MKIDKRKKYYCTLDTETTGEMIKTKNGNDIMNKYIYDIGYTIHDRKNIPIIKRNWLVKEIFLNQELMSTAYFKDKIPMYNQLLKEKKITLKSFAEIIQQLQNDLKLCNTTGFCAYNIGFDLDALMQTTNLLYPDNFKMFFRKTKKGNFMPDTQKFFKQYIAKNKNILIIDIWTLACLTLCRQKTFQTYYKKEKSGRIITNAELVYNYIIDKTDFKEEHTALADAEIETEILQRIFKIQTNFKSYFEFFPNRFAKVTE